MRLYKIAGLSLMPRPRAGDWLPDEILRLKRMGMNRVVCLMERAEMVKLGLGEEGILVENAGMEWSHFPIPDRQLPGSLKEFAALASSIADDVQAGKEVAIHCRAGIGRTGILAAAVLLRLGWKSETVFEDLLEARTLRMPDTEEQRNWILENSASFQAE